MSINNNEFDEINNLIESNPNKINLAEYSEKNYIEIVNKALHNSFNHLDTQNTSKDALRKFFSIFFCILISIEYIMFVLLLFFVGHKLIIIETSILLVYASSIFVETIGVIAFMIKFAYANETELGVLKVAQEVVNGYKKYRE